MANATVTQVKAELAYRSLPKNERPARKDWTSPAIRLSTADLKALAGEPKAEKAPHKRTAEKANPKATKATKRLSDLERAQRKANRTFNKVLKAKGVTEAFRAYKQVMVAAKAS